MSEFVPSGDVRTIVIVDRNHVVGNTLCAACDGNFPARCPNWPVCPGLLHGESFTKGYKAICDFCEHSCTS